MMTSTRAVLVKYFVPVRANPPLRKDMAALRREIHAEYVKKVPREFGTISHSGRELQELYGGGFLRHQVCWGKTGRVIVLCGGMVVLGFCACVVLSCRFGEDVLTFEQMRRLIPSAAFKEFMQCVDSEKTITPVLADTLADAMKVPHSQCVCVSECRVCFLGCDWV
jgi:hypothetical protein